MLSGLPGSKPGERSDERSDERSVAFDVLIVGVGLVGVLLTICSARRLQLLKKELVVGGDDESDEDVQELTQYPAHRRSQSRRSSRGDSRGYSHEVIEVIEVVGEGQRRHGRGVHVHV